MNLTNCQRVMSAEPFSSALLSIFLRTAILFHLIRLIVFIIQEARGKINRQQAFAAKKIAQLKKVLIRDMQTAFF